MFRKLHKLTLKGRIKPNKKFDYPLSDEKERKIRIKSGSRKSDVVASRIEDVIFVIFFVTGSPTSKINLQSLSTTAVTFLTEGGSGSRTSDK